ncbi:MAG: hypothetical protein EP347_00155 [Alphaproteobacteria bacterium]|nr:MAG: hypothetical protein EP347_00155 [Alphaproteobacteria bacterium]
MNIQQIAENALKQMKAAGFEEAQVSVGISRQDELNIALSDASLFRSTEDHGMSLKGIIDGRAASTSLTDLGEDTIAHEIAGLFDRAQHSPQDDANAVSSGQTAQVVKGPQEADLELMVSKVRELLEFRAAETPKMAIDEGNASYYDQHSLFLTSQGTSLESSTGAYGLMAMGTAREGEKSSSFAYAGGQTDDLSKAHAAEFFGIGDMLKETERQIDTRPFGGNLVGDVVLAPMAVEDLLGWLLGQLSDGQLIADSSIYKNKIGEQIASSLLTIKSRFHGPCNDGISADGFVADDFTVVDQGKLLTLMPSLYGSRKTGIAHRPTAGGWEILSGSTAKADLTKGIEKGALVTRLSMGHPGPSGDFSGVIKNSFMIENGEVSEALTETMIAGNMGQMLKDIVAISAERLDDGSSQIPWIRFANVNYS